MNSTLINKEYEKPTYGKYLNTCVSKRYNAFYLVNISVNELVTLTKIIPIKGEYPPRIIEVSLAEYRLYYSPITIEIKLTLGKEVNFNHCWNEGKIEKEVNSDVKFFITKDGIGDVIIMGKSNGDTLSGTVICRIENRLASPVGYHSYGWINNESIEISEGHVIIKSEWITL